MADEIKGIEPNPVGLALARALRTGREGLNYPGKLPEGVPLLGGHGLGDILLGKSPEAIEDYSYGFGPLGKGRGLTTRLDPRFMDVMFVPGVLGAAGKI